MIEIKDLLGRFDNILISSELKKNSIKNIISKTIGIDIKPKDIKIKNEIIYLNIKPIYKNEIFLKKEKITSLLKKALGQKAPRDLR